MPGGAGYITAADAVITLLCLPVFTTGQRIQGFASDDIFDVPRQHIAEVEMGVDGYLATGYVFVVQPWNFTLQASSPSNAVFDAVKAAQDAALATYLWQGTVTGPSLGQSWDLVNGSLTDYAPAPSAARTFRPRKYDMMWQRIIPIPFVAPTL
jgi:hypothetical protein